MTDTFADKWSVRQASNPECGGLIKVEALETNDGTKVGDRVLFSHKGTEVEMVVDKIAYLVPAGIEPYYRLECSNAGKTTPTLRRVEGAEGQFKRIGRSL